MTDAGGTLSDHVASILLYSKLFLGVLILSFFTVGILIFIHFFGFLNSSNEKRRSEKKKKLLTSFVLLIILFSGILVALPRIFLFIAGVLNSVQSDVPIPVTVSERAEKLFKSSLVTDLHADTLLWPKSLLDGGEVDVIGGLPRSKGVGHVDVDRMLKGNIALQGFTIVTRVPKAISFLSNDKPGLVEDPVFLLSLLQGWGVDALTQLSQRTLAQTSKLYHYAQQSEGKLRVIRFREELTRYLQDREKSPSPITAGYLGIEGLHALDGRLENVDTFFDAGIRTMGITHFFDNELGGSAHGIVKGGLTEFGRSVVRRMNELGILVDVAHASPQVIEDVCQINSNPDQGKIYPIIASHAGVQGVCEGLRNLDDKQIQCIARSGGVIGVAFFRPAICGPNEIDSIVSTIRYIRDLVGIDHVSFGSDFDGSVTVPFDISQLVVVADQLLASGFTETEVQKVLGSNTINLFLKAFPSESK